MNLNGISFLTKSRTADEPVQAQSSLLDTHSGLPGPTLEPLAASGT